MFLNPYARRALKKKYALAHISPHIKWVPESILGNKSHRLDIDRSTHRMSIGKSKYGSGTKTATRLMVWNEFFACMFT